MKFEKSFFFYLGILFIIFGIICVPLAIVALLGNAAGGGGNKDYWPTFYFLVASVSVWGSFSVGGALINSRSNTIFAWCSVTLCAITILLFFSQYHQDLWSDFVCWITHRDVGEQGVCRLTSDISKYVGYIFGALFMFTPFAMLKLWFGSYLERLTTK